MEGGEFKLVGWRHVEMSVPKGWFLGGEGGSKGSGFFRLEDRYRTRLELSWDTIKFEKAPLPEDAFEKCVKGFSDKVEKSSGKRPRLIHKELVEVAGHEGVKGVLKSGPWIASVVVWYCEYTEKLFMLTLLFKAGEDRRTIEDAVISSLKCHFPEGGEVLWSLYGVDLYLPVDFYLLHGVFTTGLSYAVFKHAREDVFLVATYGAMANRILKPYKDFTDFVNRKVRKEVLKKVFKFGKIDVKKEGERYSLSATGIAFLAGRMKLKGLAWVSKTDRLYIIMIVGLGKAFERHLETLERVVRHIT